MTITKKRLCAYGLLLVLAILLIGCEPSTSLSGDDTEHDTMNTINPTSFLLSITEIQSTTTYTITSSIFEENYVRISYPYIEMLNVKMQEKINSLIWQEIYGLFSWHSEWEEPVTLDIDYEIKFSSDRLLSMIFSGIGHVPGAPRPFWIFHTLNINVVNGEKIMLSDVINIDAYLIELLLSESIVYLNPDPSIKEAVREIISANDFLYHWIYSTDQIIFYFTHDSLGISITLPHVLGGYAILEINYDKLK